MTKVTTAATAGKKCIPNSLSGKITNACLSGTIIIELVKGEHMSLMLCAGTHTHIHGCQNLGGVTGSCCNFGFSRP